MCVRGSYQWSGVKQFYFAMHIFIFAPLLLSARIALALPSKPAPPMNLLPWISESDKLQPCGPLIDTHGANKRTTRSHSCTRFYRLNWQLSCLYAGRTRTFHGIQMKGLPDSNSSLPDVVQEWQRAGESMLEA